MESLESPLCTHVGPASQQRVATRELRPAPLVMVVEHMKIVVRDLLEKDAGCGRGAGPEELFL